MCKRLICLFSFVLVLGISLTGAANAADPSLVLYLPFDEGQGVPGDYSTYGHGVELVNDPQWVDGYSGNALEFDGTNYVRVPINDTLQLRETFSVAFWVKRGETQPATWNYMVAGGSLRWAVIFNANQNVYVWTRSGGSWGQRLVTTMPLTTDWTHIAMTYDIGSGVQLYFNGEEKAGEGAAPPIVDEIDGSIMVGARNPGSEFFAGIIDEVRLYNKALTEDEIPATMTGEPLPYAFGPDPKDGAKLEATWANLRWRAGDLAVSHNVYVSDNFDDVNDRAEAAFQGNQTDTTLIVGFAGFPISDGLVPGTTYYWRIDEINDADPNSPWIGDVWSFWVPPRTAYEAVPANEARFVLPGVTLDWTGGFNAKLHTVYFGDNFDGVDNASGGVAQTATTFSPGTLELDKTYYWRVDEMDPPFTHKGDVWSFTTVPDIPVSDDTNLMLWWTLDEGQGAAGPVDWSGHGEHAAIADDPHWIVDGYERGALQFDGSGDYLYRQLAPAMPSQTVCVWARIDKVPASILGWSNAHPTSGTHDREFYASADGAVAWRIWTSANNIVTSLGSIADGRWHHLAGVYTDEGTTELYLDGVFQGSNAASGIYNAYSNPFLTVGIDSQQNRYLTGAVDDVRVYNKALTADEIAQVMLGDTKLAGNPVPDRNAVVDIRDISSLSWSKGDTAASHDVYFGTDINAVASADNSSPEFQGNQAGTSLSLANLVEFGGGDYYWRVDEVESGGTVIAGTVWKFTVPDYLIVDDFESYNDLNEDEEGSNRIYLTWIDGFGTLTNGAVAGNLDPPFMSQGRESAQAMPLSYDNAGKTSEATRTLTSKKVWTVEGVTRLVIWFRGHSANAADRMFVALGNAVVYHPDDAATQDGGWNEWIIDLQEFANQGTDLTNVDSITLGFGTRGAPIATGGTGTVHFDDIRLIK